MTEELDLHFSEYDVIASKAHAKNVGQIGLLTGQRKRIVV